MDKKFEEENRRNMRYSDYEDKQILLMLNSGAIPSKIAETLGHGRTEGGVNHRINYLLNERRKPSSNITDNEAANIAKLHIEGKCSSEICNKTGRSDRTVARISRLTDVIIKMLHDECIDLSQYYNKIID